MSKAITLRVTDETFANLRRRKKATGVPTEVYLRKLIAAAEELEQKAEQGNA
jgi:hypothetical protein